MAFNLPSPLFTGAKTGSTYSRPSDWINITDTDNEVQFLFADVGTAAISLETNNHNTTSPSNIVIDWGDGSLDIVSGAFGTITNHQYVKGTGTPCSRGYTTFKIRVYLETPSVADWIRICKPGNGTSFASKNASNGVLEAVFGDGTVLYGMPVNFASNTASVSLSNFAMLEYVKLPRVMDAPEMDGAFENCSQLRKVDMPITDTLLTFSRSQWRRCFQGCANLLEVVFPSNTVLEASFGTNNTFTGCSSLRNIVLPTNNVSPHLVTTMNGCFLSLQNLESIILPSMPSCRDYASCFQECRQLTSVIILGMPTVSEAGLSLSNMFTGCLRLEYVSFPPSVSSNPTYNASNMFSGCQNLKNITFPTGFIANNLSGCFNGCSTLQDADLSCGGTLNPVLSSISTLFGSCFNLTSFSLPILTGSAAPVATNVFQNCFNLEKIIFDDSYSRLLSFSISGLHH